MESCMKDLNCCPFAILARRLRVNRYPKCELLCEFRNRAALRPDARDQLCSLTAPNLLDKQNS
jgi:hypothetical protein